jgi:[CysO sulfur-carrier protein]-S-L-cysteine hydrolase
MRMLLKSEFARLLRAAVRASRQRPGTEICGLLIDTGRHLRFVQTRNICRRRGGFAFSAPEVRRLVAAISSSGQEVVGTFHSHPVGLPSPGPSDVEHAVDDSLMFLFDCIGRRGRLWRIREGRAQPLRFGFAQRSRRSLGRTFGTSKRVRAECPD